MLYLEGKYVHSTTLPPLEEVGGKMEQYIVIRMITMEGLFIKAGQGILIVAMFV